VPADDRPGASTRGDHLVSQDQLTRQDRAQCRHHLLACPNMTKQGSITPMNYDSAHDTVRRCLRACVARGYRLSLVDLLPGSWSKKYEKIHSDGMPPEVDPRIP